MEKHKTKGSTYRLRNRYQARHGKAWVPHEIERLIELYEAGVRWGLIAQDLGRTVPTCYSKLQAVRYFYKMPASLWKRQDETLTSEKNLEYKRRY